MSSIRLFILSSFDLLGPMHGHRLRLEAERKHLTMWTDITVGAVYGAMARLTAEGLLRHTGEEKEGDRPVRQIYEITDSGREVLTGLRHAGLTEVWFKHDPFDLALTRLDPASAAALPEILARRLEALEERLAQAIAMNEWAKPHVGVTKGWALRHGEYRLRTEVAFLRDLLRDRDAVVAEIDAGKV